MNRFSLKKLVIYSILDSNVRRKRTHAGFPEYYAVYSRYQQDYVALHNLFRYLIKHSFDTSRSSPPPRRRSVGDRRCQRRDCTGQYRRYRSIGCQKKLVYSLPGAGRHSSAVAEAYRNRCEIFFY